MHVGLITRSLAYGGTERQLVILARGLHERGHRVSILQFYDDEQLAGDLPQEVGRSSLGLRGRRNFARLAWQGSRWFRTMRPDVLHGFHVESNLLAFLLARTASPRRPVVAGLRVSDPAAMTNGAVARGALRVHNRLLRAADLVLANSDPGAQHALESGARAERVRVIRNGIDVRAFRPNPDGGARVRQEWGVSANATLVGTVARIEPRKGPELFLRAAAAFARDRPETRFVWVGDGESRYRQGLEQLAARLGLGSSVIWAGWRRDLPAVHSALDLETLLSTHSEGTPNAVAEAIACGVPCVVSNVGDAPLVVGDPDRVVLLDPERAAAAWHTALERTTEQDRAAGRRRIANAFGVEQMVYETEAALERLVRPRPR